MPGPLSIPKREVPRRTLRGERLPETVNRLETYATLRAQFDQTFFNDIQRGLTDNNGQQIGGIVNASDLPHRATPPYEIASAIAPHIGDMPSQPSAVSYDGPLNFTALTLPTGVNPTYGYARWAGWLTIAVAGTYGFNLLSVGGSNLFVNMVQLIGALPATSTSASASAVLAKGVVPIVVEWQWSTAPPSLALKWTPPGSPQVLIPNTVLSRSINQVSGFLMSYWWNGSPALWMPQGATAGGGASTFRVINLAITDSPYTATLTAQATLYRASASTGGDFLFTLPPATGSGDIAIIKKMDANAHNIVVEPTGADTIDGANSAALSTVTIQYDDVRLADSGVGTWDTW